MEQLVGYLIKGPGLRGELKTLHTHLGEALWFYVSTRCGTVLTLSGHFTHQDRWNFPTVIYRSWLWKEKMRFWLSVTNQRMDCNFSAAYDHRRVQPYIWCRVNGSSPIFFLNKPFLSGKRIPNIVTERKQNIVGHFSACNGLRSPWPVSNYHCFRASGVLANENTFFFLLAFFSTQNPPRDPLAVLDTLLDWSCDSTLTGKTEELSFLRCKDCVRPLAVELNTQPRNGTGVVIYIQSSIVMHSEFYHSQTHTCIQAWEGSSFMHQRLLASFTGMLSPSRWRSVWFTMTEMVAVELTQIWDSSTPHLTG